MDAIIGDHSGIIQTFRIHKGLTTENLFSHFPTPNARVNCLDIMEYDKKAKVFVAQANMMIRGFGRKGNQFFAMDFNFLTEPVEYIKCRWPSDIFLCGSYMYHHFHLSAEPTSGNRLRMNQTDSYVCPEKITGLCLLEDRHKRKCLPVLTTKDRLIRIIRGSSCEYELETNGIPTAVISIPNTTEDSGEAMFCFGSAPHGRVSLMTIDILTEKSPPVQKWEFPDKGSKASVECLAVSESGVELFVGRSDGTIDGYSFSGSLNVEGNETVSSTHWDFPVCHNSSCMK